MGLLDGLYRVGEPALGLLSGAVAEPVAGWAGLLGGGAEGVAKTREAMTYQPRTQAGREGQNALARLLMEGKSALVDNNPPVRMAVDAYGLLADKAGAMNPLMGAALKTAPTAVGLLAGPGSQVSRNALAEAVKGTGRTLGPKAAEMAEQYMLKTGGIQPMIAWHGSPHKFDKFDMSKVGTGEGAQAFGHGMYFAESPEVAKMYRDALSTNVYVGGKRLDSAPMDGPLAAAHNKVVTSIQSGMAPDEAITNTVKYWEDAANEMRGFLKEHPDLADRINKEVMERQGIADAARKLKAADFWRDPGHLYKVDIPDEQVARFLDWDKPLSAQRGLLQGIPESTLYNLGITKDLKDAYKGTPLSGADFIRFADNQLGGGALQKYGIPGIRYLDQGSRGVGRGTSNFVVFDPSTVKILERNGIPLQQSAADSMLDKLRRRNLESASLNPY